MSPEARGGFIRLNARFLLFGLGMAAVSSFGQTFFISLFGGEIRAALSLDHRGFGLIYSAMTITSGLSMLVLGRLIDRVDLRRYAAAALGLLLAGALLMAAAVHWVLLAPAILLLRLGGQGLCSHVAVTSMARYFDRERGRAIAIASLGFPLSEGVLPTAGVALLAVAGRHGSWLAVALVILALAPVLLVVLLRGHAGRDAAWRARLAALAAAPAPGRSGGSGAARSWTVRQVMRDPRFYGLLPAVLAAPFLVTAVFFHHVHLVELKGWHHASFAASFTAFALAQVAVGLPGGALVDRVGARRLAGAVPVPLALALLVLASCEHPWTAPVMMALLGVTSGLVGPVFTALWAECYGTEHLGAIRGLLVAIMVVSTGASPALFGIGLDADVTVAVLFGTAAGGTLAAAALATWMCRTPPHDPPSACRAGD